MILHSISKTLALFFLLQAGAAWAQYGGPLNCESARVTEDCGEEARTAEQLCERHYAEAAEKDGAASVKWHNSLVCSDGKPFGSRPECLSIQNAADTESTFYRERMNNDAEGARGCGQRGATLREQCQCALSRAQKQQEDAARREDVWKRAMTNQENSSAERTRARDAMIQAASKRAKAASTIDRAKGNLKRSLATIDGRAKELSNMAENAKTVSEGSRRSADASQ